MLNPLPAQLKGGLLALGSAACISVTFIASKQAMRELSPLAFTPLWFAAASLWGAGFYVARHGPRIPDDVRQAARPILLLGLFNGAANFLLFTAIKLGDPTLAAFFSRSETIYSVLLGALLLGERMQIHQWVGVVTAIAGAGVMTFQAGVVVWLMFGLLLISNFFLSLSTLVAKKNVITVRPLVLCTARVALMSLMLGWVGLMAGQLAWPNMRTWLWIIGGAFFGPFLSYVFFYQALLYLDLAQGAVIRATQPLFVAVYGLILFGTFITAHQFIGGLLMIVGVGLMLWPRTYRPSYRQKIGIETTK